MQDEGTKPPSKLKFIYKKADDYRQCYVNGAYGFFSPRGDFMFDFFYEFKELPTVQEAEVNEDTGQLKYDNIDIPVIPEFVREVRLGVIMSPQQLVNLRDWLDKQIKEYKDNVSDGT